MRQTLRLGRIAGIPIGTHWSVLVIMILLAQGLARSILPASAPNRSALAYWLIAIAMAVVFLAGLLFHELAHALVARHYGIRVRRITLWLLGGVTELEGDAPHARGDFFVALAGPVASVVFAAIFGLGTLLANAAGAPSLATTALGWLALVNVVLAVFNLLPGSPLDGGRVLRAAVWWVRGDRRAAQRVANRAGMVLGLLLIAGGVAEVVFVRNLGGLWLALIGWFLMLAARAEDSDGGLQDALRGLRVEDAMTSPAVYGSTSQTVDSFIDSVARRHPHPAYPVLDAEGRLAGIVTLSNLAQVDAPHRPNVRLDAVQVPLWKVTVLDPGASLVEPAQKLLGDGHNGHRIAPVVSNQTLVGVLTVGDVNRSLEMASLQARTDRTSAAPPPPESTTWRK